MNASSKPNGNGRIMIVDDDPKVRRALERVLQRQGFAVFQSEGGEPVFKQIEDLAPDLLLLDLAMPGLDGFTIAKTVKGNPAVNHIPIILLTGLDGVDNHVKAFDIGVDDFMSKTADPAEILARVRYHLKIKAHNDRLHTTRVYLEDTVALKSGQLVKALDQLKDASIEIIWRLTAASEYRDNETGAHIRRMSHYSAAIARRLKLKSKAVEAILYAAPMHDIGKIGIPDKILLKPGKLDTKEWEVMRMHPIIGANILKDSRISFIRMGATVALTHHEKWDGSGYPQGLAGPKIPLAGRIVALADVFDALTSERPYKEAFSIEQARQLIIEQRGKHFDPQVVDAFLAIPDEILKIKETYQDQRDSLLECMEGIARGQSCEKADLFANV
jgi:putative two-component system response regulator